MSKLSHVRHFSKRALTPGCSNGAFYKSPPAGANIDTSSKILIEWDTSLNCFSTQGVDIYLYAPLSAKPILHGWGGVDYSAGSFSTDIVGSWWNSTSQPITLRLGFVESGKPAFNLPIPQGPTFTSTFNSTDFTLKHPTGSVNGTTAGDSSQTGIFQTIGNAYKNSGLPKGSIAAAVLVPLIALIVAVAAWFRYQRKKEAEQRKRWSAAVDKRMSTISGDWKPGVPRTSEAIRQSIAEMRQSRLSVARMSQVMADGRPSSTFASEGDIPPVPSINGMRKGPGIGLRNPAMGPGELAERKSKISFAADTVFGRSSSERLSTATGSGGRPSTDSRPGSNYTRASRAYHTAIVPDQEAREAYERDILMSPSQTNGPKPLGVKDINDRISIAPDLSSDDLAPALNMMHANEPYSARSDDNFLMLSPAAPTPPSPAHISPSSPSMPTNGGSHLAGFFTNQPGSMMSPDAMLQAYARGKKDAGNTMQVAGTPTSASSPHYNHFAPIDTPAPPAHDLVPDMPPTSSSRSLYPPSSEDSRYSITDFGDAYGGYGHAA